MSSLKRACRSLNLTWHRKVFVALPSKAIAIVGLSLVLAEYNVDLPRIFAQPWPPDQAECVTPPSGMIDWWPGDGNAHDIQGDNDGTLEGDATFGAGEVNDAFSLDGQGDYVDVGSVNLPVTFTIGGWF